MGGKQKKLTQAGRKKLQAEITAALVEGRLQLQQGQSVDNVLDEVDEGIKSDKYPIGVDLAGLMAVWFGQAETPAPEPDPKEAETVKEQVPTVDQIQAAQAQQPHLQAVPDQQYPDAGLPAPDPMAAAHAFQQRVQDAYAGPPEQNPYIAGSPANLAAAAEVAQTATHPQQVIEAAMLPPQQVLADAAQPIDPSQISVSVAAPGSDQFVPVPGQLVQGTVQATPAQLAAQLAGVEVGQPEPAPPVEVDMGPLHEWVDLYRGSKAKLEQIEAIMNQAKEQIVAYVDEQGGPDRSKVGLLNGELVVKRTWHSRKTLDKSKLYANHPELAGIYEEPKFQYRTEIL